MLEVAARARTPMISMAASARIVEPMDDVKRWVFKAPQSDALMATALTQHMSDSGVKTVAYIGFNDAYGEGWASGVRQVRRPAQDQGRRQRALQPHRHLA